ncbi:O-methyltransferase-like protein family 3 [Teratosphaeria destructans]|uniref:O-methyltransferase-like protein family 3 n=1 Tax=Teratosphaeria destructans TaxID=418781 RepID=A0A9W7W5J0_9PEZI|nr:O-methyltransferase-like protein family 3 [Teratosphaeria destructans]
MSRQTPIPRHETATKDNPIPHLRWEQDPRWTAVDQYALSHLFPPTSPYFSALQYARDQAAAAGLRSIEVSALQGRFLRLQCMLIGAKNILEVGTLGGYSSIILASSSPEAKVTTIEIEEKNKAVAEKAIANAGLSERINVLLGAGVDVLPRLRKEIDEGRREKFRFVFIDADKENGLHYLNDAIPMCEPGSLIVVDNVVRKGSLADEEIAKFDSKTAGSRAVVEGAGRDERIESTLLQTVGEKNYDGFLLCYVK